MANLGYDPDAPDPGYDPDVHGDRDHYTELGDMAIKVPTDPENDSFEDPTEPFIDMATSMLHELQRVLARFRSLVLFQDAVEATDGWILDKSKLRVIGEAQGYLEVDFTRDGPTIVVPSNGDFDSIIVANITDERLRPQSLAFLGSANIGRLAMGYALNDGSIKLSSLNSGQNIEDGDHFSLVGGPWPMDDWLDSED